jgi:hypothetical protein
MRLFNIINALLKEKQIKVFVEPTDYFAANIFYIDNNNFTKFLHETLAIDGSVHDYFAENKLDVIIDGIYCYLIFNNEIIINDKKETA